MKIIYYPVNSRRRTLLAKPKLPTIDTRVPLQIHPAARAPWKKALFIGLNYGEKPKHPLPDGELWRSHKDVQDMANLLCRKYGYEREDVVILMDTDNAREHLVPTRANIMREIRELVKGAKKGDKFFFHYAGEGGQAPNKTNSEEDGMDEYILPADWVENQLSTLICDDDLKKYLVDALPVGCSLTAIFDCCHSQSLLDLTHYRCNRVFVPWISKGRRKSDSFFNYTVRRLAHFTSPHRSPVTATAPSSQTTSPSASMSASGADGSTLDNDAIPQTISPTTIYQFQRNPKRVLSRRTTIDYHFDITSHRKEGGAGRMKLKRTVKSRSLSLNTRFETVLPPKPPGWDVSVTKGKKNTEENNDEDTENRESTLIPTAPTTPTPTTAATARLMFESEGRFRSDSPVPMHECFECDGFCREKMEREERKRRRNGMWNKEKEQEEVDVISIASCEDGQIAWSDAKGRSMSSALVDILDEDPHPSLKSLLLRVSHNLHERIRAIHDTNKQWSKDIKAWEKRKKMTRQQQYTQEQTDFNNFQDPQISSAKPLDMERPFDP